MVSRFAAVTNKEISQIIKRAVPEIPEEDDEIRFEIFLQLIALMCIQPDF